MSINCISRKSVYKILQNAYVYMCYHYVYMYSTGIIFVNVYVHYYRYLALCCQNIPVFLTNKYALFFCIFMDTKNVGFHPNILEQSQSIDDRSVDLSIYA